MKMFPPMPVFRPLHADRLLVGKLPGHRWRRMTAAARSPRRRTPHRNSEEDGEYQSGIDSRQFADSGCWKLSGFTGRIEWKTYALPLPVHRIFQSPNGILARKKQSKP